MTSTDPSSVNLLGDPRQATRDRMVRRARLVRGLIAVSVIATFLGSGYYLWGRVHPKVVYQMVFLANGQVYIGKLEELGSSFAVLTDVLYFQSQVDPQTKESRSVLVRRRDEIHAPDRMMINTQHIIVLEPVKQDSSLAKRIADMREKE